MTAGEAEFASPVAPNTHDDPLQNGSREQGRAISLRGEKRYKKSIKSFSKSDKIKHPINNKTSNSMS